MAATAAAPPPALPAPLASPQAIHRRIPAAIPSPAASPICAVLGSRCLHRSALVSCTSRQGLVPACHFGTPNLTRNCSVLGYAAAAREFGVPAWRPRLFSRAELFEFTGGVCRPSTGAIAAGAAGAGAVRGDSGFFEYEWMKEEAVEGVKGAKQFLMIVLKNLESRRQKIIQWAPWLAAVIGTVTLAGVLVSRFGVGRVFSAMVIAASCFALLVDDEKLQLIGEGFEPVSVKAGHQVHILSETIAKVAHDSHKFLAACLPSFIPILGGNLEGETVKNLPSRGSLLTAEAGGFSFAPSSSNEDSRGDIPGLDCEPSTESLVTTTSESISQLSSVISTAGLSAAHPDSLSGIKSGIARVGTARGSSFGSMDDLDDNGLQEQRRRRSFEEEDQQQNLRRDLPRRSSSSSRAGQPWDGKYQPVAPGREALRDEQRMNLNADSSTAADDYRRVEADVRGLQVLRVDRDLEETNNTPPVNMERRSDEGMSQTRYRTDSSGDLVMERGSDEGIPQPRYRKDPSGDLVYPASAGRRASPPGRTVSPRSSNSGPSTSREGGWNTQSIDGARIADDANNSGSKRVRDVPPNSEGLVSRRQERGTRNGKGAPDSSMLYAPTQPEVIESSFALEQSKQAKTVQFQNYLDEADALLEQGMQGIEGRIEVAVAERMLYEAADLLVNACQIYPADLIAVGQLGNTLLVHGQLKLKLSRQLRSMLPSPNANYPLMKGEAGLARREQESMELTLQEVCEECEELLVDAGRKFRTALSLDKSDVRALYNWGLALCYRGQLIADEGGERAKQDADKVYLAAIDKFEAMLGISQDYVSGALVNWGLAIRDRARLRDMGDKERVQLLLQAKELFQDAVRLDPSNGQARGAVAVCSAELKELQNFDPLQREDTRPKPQLNWWQRRG